jgi:hypothetical protein
LPRCFLTLAFQFPAQAEEKNPTKGLGVSLGYVSGFGFSYRYFPQKGIGYQAGIIYIATKKDTYFNLDSQADYILHRGSSMAFYLVGGLGFESKTNKTKIVKIISL